ncbi:hypothetical protein BB561_001406 [Smittium simulii]|uniref:NADH dehydrogenase [ubiquinone] 1 beta subcomplex subunit 8, mitochondrial n=1 Tax=Smittium simulii TaxID=133385 RepID=A0A2T9YUW9_9FUNG|nr:hypothetical protein BB561_001406 [Smittium simulii]
MNRVFTRMQTPSPMRALLPNRMLGYGIRFESGGPQYKKKYYVDPDPQIGDYPNLPFIKGELKTPYGWWDRQMRRNFGDTLQEHEDILGTQSNSEYYTPPWSKVLMQWTVFVSILGTGAYIISFYVPERPAIPRHYPFNGLENELGGKPAMSFKSSIESVANE